MRRLSLFLLAVSLFSLSGCLQNFKDSELSISNRSKCYINLHVNGEKVSLSPGDEKLFTSDSIRNDVYQYSTTFSDPLDSFYTGITFDEKTVTPGSGLSGTLDFTSQGKRISLEYFGYDDISVDKDTNGVITSSKLDYKLNAIYSEGWVD